jgi:hypothetical protein
MDRKQIEQEITMLTRLLERCDPWSEWRPRIENRLAWLKRKMEEK